MSKISIDDGFKSWLRQRMKNKGFAEMLMRKLTETEDSTLTDVWRTQHFREEVTSMTRRR